MQREREGKVLLTLAAESVQPHRLQNRGEVDGGASRVLAVCAFVSVILDVEHSLLRYSERSVIGTVPGCALLSFMALFVDGKLHIVKDALRNLESILQAGDHVVLLCSCGEPLDVVDIHLVIVFEAILMRVALAILALIIVNTEPQGG